jgi:hypothetical protein
MGYLDASVIDTQKDPRWDGVGWSISVEIQELEAYD